MDRRDERGTEEELRNFFADDAEFPPDLPLEVEDEEPALPPWVAPPADVLPGLVPVRRVLARTAQAVIVLRHVDVYATGCLFTLGLSIRRPPDLGQRAWWGRFERLSSRHAWGASDPTGDGPRYGVRLPDGTRLRTIDVDAGHERFAEPSGPVLQLDELGGGGDDHGAETEHQLWLWPLPPAGDVDLVVAWPAVDIGPTQLTLDGARLGARAADAEPFFPAS